MPRTKVDCTPEELKNIADEFLYILGSWNVKDEEMLVVVSHLISQVNRKMYPPE